MKILSVICFLIIQVNTFAQVSKNLVGVWKFKKVVSDSGKPYKGVEKYILTINPDSSYHMNFGGTSWISGKWELEGNKIKFDANTIADPCMNWISDEKFRSFVLISDDTLIIDMYICGNLEGKSYYKKKKTLPSNG